MFQTRVLKLFRHYSVPCADGFRKKNSYVFLNSSEESIKKSIFVHFTRQNVIIAMNFTIQSFCERISLWCRTNFFIIHFWNLGEGGLSKACSRFSLSKLEYQIYTKTLEKMFAWLIWPNLILDDISGVWNSTYSSDIFRHAKRWSIISQNVSRIFSPAPPVRMSSQTVTLPTVDCHDRHRATFPGTAYWLRFFFAN